MMFAHGLARAGPVGSSVGGNQPRCKLRDERGGGLRSELLGLVGLGPSRLGLVGRSKTTQLLQLRHTEEFGGMALLRGQQEGIAGQGQLSIRRQ